MHFSEKVFIFLSIIVVEKVMKSFWYTTKRGKKKKRKRNIFKATNVKSTEHLRAGQWVKKTQMEKSQSVYALVWSPVFSRVFSSLKVYPSQCSALRMHTCSATMIHIITTFGDDSNQKPEVQPANNLKRPWQPKKRSSQKRTKSTLLFLTSSGKEMSACLRLPLRTKHTRVQKHKRLRETHAVQTDEDSKYHNTNRKKSATREET